MAQRIIVKNYFNALCYKNFTACSEGVKQLISELKKELFQLIKHFFIFIRNIFGVKLANCRFGSRFGQEVIWALGG